MDLLGEAFVATSGSNRQISPISDDFSTRSATGWRVKRLSASFPFAPKISGSKTSGLVRAIFPADSGSSIHIPSGLGTTNRLPCSNANRTVWRVPDGIPDWAARTISLDATCNRFRDTSVCEFGRDPGTCSEINPPPDSTILLAKSRFDSGVGTSTPLPKIAHVFAPYWRALLCPSVSIPSASPDTTPQPLLAASSTTLSTTRSPNSVGCLVPTTAIHEQSGVVPTT